MWSQSVRVGKLPPIAGTNLILQCLSSAFRSCYSIGPSGQIYPNRSQRSQIWLSLGRTQKLSPEGQPCVTRGLPGGDEPSISLPSHRSPDTLHCRGRERLPNLQCRFLDRSKAQKGLYMASLAVLSIILIVSSSNPPSLILLSVIITSRSFCQADD